MMSEELGMIPVGAGKKRTDASLTPEERREAVRIEKILDKAVRTSVRTIPKK